jgi:hypothetical protein
MEGRYRLGKMMAFLVEGLAVMDKAEGKCQINSLVDSSYFESFEEISILFG